MPERPLLEEAAAAAAPSPVEGLLAAVAGLPAVEVRTHRNPDPDALASAVGLKYLLEKRAGLRVAVYYEGVIGRAENRAMVRHLRFHVRPLEPQHRADWSRVALVDTQPRSGNNSFPRGRRPCVVIDHHPRLKSTVGGWVDVRPYYGATATVLCEYLNAAGVGIPAWLATGLAYAISSETSDLGRGANERDLEAYLHLFPLARKRLLAQIEHPRLPRSYFAVLDRALHRAFSYRNVIGSRLGAVDSPDSVSGIADFLLAHERMGWALVTGRHGGQLHLSLRSMHGRGAGRLLRELLGKRGTAGGHGRMAGGQVDIAGLSPSQADALEEDLLQRFLGLLRFHERAEFRPLIQRGAEAGAPEAQEPAQNGGPEAARPAVSAEGSS